MATSLTVRAAGLDWVVETDREDVGRGLADWLGPWAGESAPGSAAGFAPVAGLVRIHVAAPNEIRHHPPGPPGEADGFSLACTEYGISMSARDGHEVADVVCLKGMEIAAARAAFRVLATRAVIARGGIALHASSVRTAAGLVVFAGPSGAGKTSAAEAFPDDDRIDPDLVLLVEGGRIEGAGRWVRLDHFDEYEPRRYPPGKAAGLALRAVLLPAAGSGFALRSLRGAEAVAACLHLPPPAITERRAGAEGTADVSRDAAAAMARVERLVHAVPVARFTWSLRDDLPSLLEEKLR